MGVSNLVEMAVKGLTIDPLTSMPIVILKDKEDKLSLPIWIGLIEASAIATELESIKLTRPMTHDLMKNVMDEFAIKIAKIVVHDLADNTFYAKIFFQKNGKEWACDARPSDAIALSLRLKAPIFVEREVIDKSRKIDLSGEGKDKESARRQKLAELLENLSPEDFGKYKM